MRQIKGGARIAMAAVLVWLSLGPAGSEAQHHPAHESGPDLSRPLQEGRVALGLPQAAQEGLQLTMREHLEALEAIVAALAQADFAGAAMVAHEGSPSITRRCSENRVPRFRQHIMTWRWPTIRRPKSFPPCFPART